MKADGQDVSLVKIKNPWAKERYAGAWSDEDPKWTQELKGKVKFDENKKQRVFWIPIQTFIDNFGQFAVVLSEDSWQVSRRELNLKNEAKLSIKFNNPVNQDFAVTFEGLNSRMGPEGCFGDWPKQVPAQIAIVQGDSKVVAQ